jgi:hypothetical protein
LRKSHYKGSETRFPKPKPNFASFRTDLASFRTFREFLDLKIGFWFQELDFGAFPKPASFISFS